MIADIWTEDDSYHVAVCAANNTPFSKDLEVCSLCKGCGLLPHPTAYMGVAHCYMCHNGLRKIKKQPQVDTREICNANAKTVSA
jgi:hypothetical protein